MPNANLLSAHSLEIETNRGNATPLEQQICKFCTSPHFLLVSPILAVNARTVSAIVPPQGCEAILIEILQSKRYCL